MHECLNNIKLQWVVTVWHKWQIVIPKEIREKIKINTGDSLAIILKDDKYVWLIKNEDISDLYKYIKSEDN
jgi:AbrB family looped-hinge helix DNA binding protein